MRSNVVLPPPDGPIKTRLCTSLTSKEIPSRATWSPKRLIRFDTLSFKSQSVFQASCPKRNRQRKNKISHRERNVGFQSAVSGRIDVAGDLSEFVYSDNREQ